MTGTIAGFTSTGIDDNATSTAITIDASENVGIGTTSPSVPLDVRGGASSNWAADLESTNATGWGTKILGGADGGDYSLLVKNYADTSLFEVRADGRGLSQFTAKAWVNFNGTGTVAIRDSHNVSSITDSGVGTYDMNFTNTLGSAYYVPVTSYNTSTSNTSPHHHISSIAAGSFRINAFENNTATDQSFVMALVFGD
jgi:hypothetical protein